MQLALFDLDNTLLSGDSDHEWTQHLIELKVLDRASCEKRNDEFFAQYKQGSLDIEAFLEFQLEPLRRHSRAELEAWHAAFMSERVRPMLSDAARALVRRHQKNGDLCALVTATNSFVTGPIARELGVAHLIATIPAQENGRFTGKSRGTPSFREGKVIRVNDWLESLGLWLGSFEKSWFYSDSLNDLPLLSLVSDPVAVDPDATLLAHARQAGWTVLKLHGKADA